MTGEKRIAQRKPLKYPARLLFGDGTPPRECLLADVSTTGARIVLKGEDQVPDLITLLMGTLGAVPRRCRVVWRKGLELGLEFKQEPRPRPKSRFKRRTEV